MCQRNVKAILFHFLKITMKKIMSIKYKFFCFMLGTIIVYVMLMFKFFNTKMLSRDVAVNLKYVVVHIDLKGAPPKLEYLESLVPLFKHNGVNGILMEYEDMFPYEGTILNVSSKNRYDSDKLRNFLIMAARFEIEIIPLIQTFGHMEHVLKLNEFQHLRESEAFPDSICPSNPKSIELITEMLSQVIVFHVGVAPLKHIHIGCDEVFHINLCDKCSKKLETTQNLFAKHVLAVKKAVNDLSPETSILMWDDMLRNNMKREFSANHIQVLREIEPVYWDYKPVIQHSPRLNLYVYQKTFNNFWISTAFKGADGRYRNTPVYKNRVLNHINWMNVLMSFTYKNEKVKDCKGIIITGWSRYSHMEPLCELLPTSMTSLILNLLVIKKFREGVSISNLNKDPSVFLEQYILDEFSDDFECDVDMSYRNLDESVNFCASGSSRLYLLLRQYESLTERINQYMNSDICEINSLEYYSKIQNINMNNINVSLKIWQNVVKDIDFWDTHTREVMSNYFDDFVIDEYVGSKTYAINKNAKKIVKILKDYNQIRTWESRPELYSVIIKRNEVKHEKPNLTVYFNNSL